MTQTNNINFEHRRSTTSEGFAALGMWLSSLVVAFFLFVIQHMFAPDSNEFKVGLIVISSVITIFCFFYAFVNFRARGYFVCRIDDDQLSVISPFKDDNESFSISIKEITKIVKDLGDEGAADKWYLWNAAGEKFQMPTNYENPVEKFIEEILDRRPDLNIIETSYLGLKSNKAKKDDSPK